MMRQKCRICKALLLRIFIYLCYLIFMYSINSIISHVFQAFININQIVKQNKSIQKIYFKIQVEIFKEVQEFFFALLGIHL
jgi:hypothetical protein